MSPASPQRRRPGRVIDIHAHIVDEVVVARSANRTVLSGFGLRPFVPRPERVNLREKMLKPEVQIADMDERGIDMHVLTSSTVVQGTGWADPKTADELNRRCNDTIAGWVAKYPKRFAGACTLPLQDLDLALKELRRAVKELGFKAAQISSNAGGVYLGDPPLRPLWDEVHALGVTVFIHPEGITDPWFQTYALWNSLGQSIEETKVMASLIYGGVFEKYPDLKIVMAHGGGYMPHYMGRMDRNVTNMPDSMRNITKPPSAYLRHFHYDTCVYDPQVIRALIQRVGADRIVLGSDYPVGEKDPVGFVERCGVSDDELDMIAGRTLAGLLGI